jgi:riboflavin kinase/FMN adenylyltransferase
MRVFTFREPAPDQNGVCLTIGNFDGVHLGHQALIRHVVERAQATGCASVVVTFDPHPQRVLRDRAVPLLTTLPLRLRLFEGLGVDRACIIPFTRELAAMEPEAFVTRYLLERFSVRRIVIGYDFAFGRNRAGTAAVLERLSERHGFALEVFPAVALGEEVVSSTRIRTLLGRAEFGAAERLLGRPWSLLAPVERGRRLGRTLGFPTINQLTGEVLPIPFGIYAARAIVDGRRFDAASSYGVRPTLGENQPVFETHLLDFQGELYDRLVEVVPVAWLREERRFDTLEALKAQMAEDCRRARARLVQG